MPSSCRFGEMGDIGGMGRIVPGKMASARRQEAEGRRQEAGGRRQEAEGRRQKAEGRRQKAEGKKACRVKFLTFFQTDSL